MPEVAPISVTSQGEQVATITRDTQFEPTDYLRKQDVPTEYDDKELADNEALVLFTAALHAEPNRKYTYLTEKANKLIEGMGLQPLSYDKVRELVQWFYDVDTQTPSTGYSTTTMTNNQTKMTDTRDAQSDIKEDSNIKPDAKRLSELTAIQQAIVITDIYGKVTDEVTGGFPRTRIGEIIGCANSYPGQAFNEDTSGVNLSPVRDRVFEKVKSRGLEEVVLQLCTTEDLLKMNDEGYLDDLDFDILSIVDEKTSQDTGQTGAEIRSNTDVTGQTSSDSGQDSTDTTEDTLVDRPVSDAKKEDPLSADPFNSSQSGTSGESSTQPSTEGDSEATTSPDTQQTDSAPSQNERENTTSEDQEQSQQQTRQSSTPKPTDENESSATADSGQNERPQSDRVNGGTASQPQSSPDQESTTDTESTSPPESSTSTDTQVSQQIANEGDAQDDAGGTGESEQSDESQPSNSPSTQSHQADVDTVLREVEQIRQFVEWQREMLDHEADLAEGDRKQHRLHSTLAQLEAKLEDALAQASD